MKKDVNSLTPEDFFIKEVDGDASFIDIRLKISKENRNKVIIKLAESVRTGEELIEGVEISKIYFSNTDIEQEFENKKKEFITQVIETMNSFKF